MTTSQKLIRRDIMASVRIGFECCYSHDELRAFIAERHPDATLEEILEALISGQLDAEEEAAAAEATLKALRHQLAILRRRVGP